MLRIIFFLMDRMGICSLSLSLPSAGAGLIPVTILAADWVLRYEECCLLLAFSIDGFNPSFLLLLPHIMRGAKRRRRKRKKTDQ